MEEEWVSKVTNKNEIGLYLHCARCLKDIPAGESAESYTRYGVGWTEVGLQVWCVRHDCNVINIDFEGAQHPSNMARKAPPKLKTVS